MQVYPNQIPIVTTSVIGPFAEGKSDKFRISPGIRDDTNARDALRRSESPSNVHYIQTANLWCLIRHNMHKIHRKVSYVL